jgi:hypothetical protein
LLTTPGQSTLTEVTLIDRPEVRGDREKAAQLENDVVRPFGDDTLVDIWLDGRFRAITITKAAIETYLSISHEQGSSVSQKDRREFVRTHLKVVSTAAARQLRTNPSKDKIVLGSGELQHPALSLAA